MRQENKEENHGGEQKIMETSEDNNKLMAVLAYIGPLVIVSYIFAKENHFVKFHIKQGLILFVAEIGLWVLGMIIFMPYPFIQLVQLIIFVFIVIGVINAAKGHESPLPIIGHFAKHFNI